MPKLYHENGGWTVPGKQGRKAERVDVPSVPFDLAVWLNERRVPLRPCNTQLASEPWDTTGAAEATGFDIAPPLPKPSAEKIPGHCAACGRSAAGTLKLQLGNDLDAFSDWLEDRDLGDLWALRRAGELIRERVRKIGGQLDEGGNA